VSLCPAEPCSGRLMHMQAEIHEDLASQEMALLLVLLLSVVHGQATKQQHTCPQTLSSFSWLLEATWGTIHGLTLSYTGEIRLKSCRRESASCPATKALRGPGNSLLLLAALLRTTTARGRPTRTMARWCPQAGRACTVRILQLL
jgi:hypothetical protein